jgi:hypothetical protein
LIKNIFIIVIYMDKLEVIPEVPEVPEEQIDEFENEEDEEAWVGGIRLIITNKTSGLDPTGIIDSSPS